MSDTGLTSEKEIKQKKVSWSTIPCSARQTFIMGIVMVPITIAIALTFMGFANVFYTIPLAITLSLAIIIGLTGIILGSLSIQKQKTAFGIIGLILGIIIALSNAFLMFILYCDAWFSVPY